MTQIDTAQTAAPRMIFVNLPVADLDASRRFWTALGFTFNESFCNGDALCLEINELSSVMLLRTDFFHGFFDTVAPPSETTGALYCISAASRDDVVTLCETAFANGAQPVADPKDMGSMFGWSFRDIDGHLWEPMWMDPAIDG